MPTAPPPPRPSREEWRPNLRRSVRLFQEFRLEQSDPQRFYSVLASDTAAQVSAYTDLDGALMLDVGGGPGFFRDAFSERGARYFALESDVGEMSRFGADGSNWVVGSGMQLPFKDAAFDLTFSSNVLEHVSDPWLMGSEMLRVTRPGGTVFLSYGPWWGPWGGHETSPWHYLGGHYARRRYARKHGTAPKNRFGESLFVTTVHDGLRWGATQDDADLVAAFPRYNPRWSWWLTRIPLVRELVTWNLVLVLRKR